MAGTLPNRTIDISSIVPGLDGKVRPHDPLGLQGGGLRYLLDDFVYPDNIIPDVFNDGSGPRKLWRPGADTNIVTINPTAGILGGPCLQVESTLYGNSKPAHVTYYNNRNNAQGSGVNNWHYLREIVDNPHNPAPMNWQGIQAADFFRLNRIRFWVKVASNITWPNPQNNNLHFGTYNRGSGTSRVSNEDSNNHYYHEYNVGYSGNWQQCIVDPHPNNQRSPGAADPGDIFTTLYRDQSYFDSMTWFYFQHSWQAISVPTAWLFDHVEFYEETNAEDVVNVSSVSGVLSTVEPNRIILGWKAPETTDAKSFTVKYAWNSFHRNGGWAHGVVAPGGAAVPQPDPGAYNGCRYSTDQIDLTGRDIIYFAIQRDGFSGFREIAIPLTDNGYAMMGITA